jgi:mannose-6-phosphate isomerase-like protein (cupin superfamily)
VHENEVFFIPEGMRHQVFNLGAKNLRYLFAIGPKL